MIESSKTKIIYECECGHLVVILETETFTTKTTNCAAKSSPKLCYNFYKKCQNDQNVPLNFRGC